MFLVGRGRCGGRRNPRLAAALGISSATMMVAAALLERNDGAHWPISVAVIVCLGLTGLAVFRLFAMNRDDGRR
ncbi:hypothetical protein BXU08_10535 [Sphingomonas sp. LM7]|nr:hypothetical protein BXU08_10535 [Sphingomonas sp. LM7]